MLYITFGKKDDIGNNLIYDSNGMIRWRSKPSWFEGELVKKMIKDVDNSDLLSPYCIQSPVLGQIPPERLSGGVKMLITILGLNDPDAVYYATRMGDNCAKWLVEISKTMDIKILLSHIMKFNNIEGFNAVITNDNSVVHSAEEYVEKALKFLPEYKGEQLPIKPKKDLTLEEMFELTRQVMEEKKLEEGSSDE